MAFAGRDMWVWDGYKGEWVLGRIRAEHFVDDERTAVDVEFHGMVYTFVMHDGAIYNRIHNGRPDWKPGEARAVGQDRAHRRKRRAKNGER